MKYFLLAVFAVGVLVAGCERAMAQTACPTGAVAPDAARLCWRNASHFCLAVGPLQCEDGGEPIPATGPRSLERTEIRAGACSATAAPSTVSIVLRVDATEGVAIFSNQPPGWQCWSVRHELENGDFGLWSAWVRKELKAPVPPKSKAPTVTIS